MKRWLWILAGLSVVLVASLALHWRNSSLRAAETLERHRRDLAVRIADLRARDASRPSPLGAGVPGNAWESYLQAFALMKAMPAQDRDEIPAMRGDPTMTPDPDKLEDVFRRNAPIVAQLRDALACRQVDPGFAYEQGSLMDYGPITDVIATAKFLSGAAAWEHGRGRDAEALEMLILAIGMGHDQARRAPLVNTLISNICESIAAEEWREVLRTHQLTFSDARRIAGMLATLEENRPGLGDSYAVEDLVMRRLLVRCADEGIKALGAGAPALGDIKLLLELTSDGIAAALDEAQPLARRLAEVHHLPTWGRIARARIVAAEEEARTRSVARMLMTTFVQSQKGEVAAIRNLALMRVATAIAGYQTDTGGNPPSLDALVPRYLAGVPSCPQSGKAFGYADGNLWSFGWDGDDDAGRAVADEDDEKADGDVVWTVKRK